MAAFDEKEYTKAFDLKIWKRLLPILARYKKIIVLMVSINGLTALMDGSVGEEDLMNPSSNARILRSGTLRATASNTEITARLTGLTREGSYYLSAMLEDARGRRSPVKVLAFTTPDDSAPNFAAAHAASMPACPAPTTTTS